MVCFFHMKDASTQIEMQERDISLLKDLYMSRIMSLSHIAALHFEGKSEAAKKRVQKLKAAGYIAERPRKAREPSALSLTKEAFVYLDKRGHLSEYPTLSLPAFLRRACVSELTVRHELEVMDAKASLVPAIEKMPGMQVVEFTTWPMMIEFDVAMQRKGDVRVKPDGFIRAEETTTADEVYEYTFFLEVDRGTETLDTLTERAHCYREHYASGGFALSRGGAKSQREAFPYRVLVVLPSEARRDNLAEKLLTLNPPIETQVWLTTRQELMSDPLGAIWVRPREYRGNSQHTPLHDRNRSTSTTRILASSLPTDILRHALFGGSS